MILADTAIWIGHWNSPNSTLDELVEQGQVLCHPIIIGELACGTFAHRELVLAEMARLPQIMEAGHHEVLALIENHRLMGSGIGWSDAHLLASALLDESLLWTLDKRLSNVARRLHVHAGI